MEKLPVKIAIIFLFLLTPFYFSIASEPLNVVINEIAWMGNKNGWQYEWVELYNPTEKEINLAGWKILNGGIGGKTLEISTGKISSNGYFLICKKEMGNCDLKTWGLSLKDNYKENGKLILEDIKEIIIDETPQPINSNWPAGDKNDSETMERIDSSVPGNNFSNWQTSKNPGGTPKSKNSLIEKATTSQEIAMPEPELTVYPKKIFINEILPSPEGPDSENEWVEISNENDFEVDISGWQIRDKVGVTKTYTIPEGTKISPKGFLILSRPETKITLQNSGDGLELLAPNGKVIDSLNYGKAPLNQSYSRTPSGWRWSTTLTPGKGNVITQPETLEVKTNKSPIKKTEKVKEEGNQKIPLEKLTSAKIGEGISKPSNPLIIFLAAVGIAIGSAIIVVFLKKKLIGEAFEAEEKEWKL